MLLSKFRAKILTYQPAAEILLLKVAKMPRYIADDDHEEALACAIRFLRRTHRSEILSDRYDNPPDMDWREDDDYPERSVWEFTWIRLDGLEVCKVIVRFNRHCHFEGNDVFQAKDIAYQNEEFENEARYDEEGYLSVEDQLRHDQMLVRKTAEIAQAKAAPPPVK